ncbi:hypothetical protein GH733_009609 [Mirounga leonina]|nr:hypothetical protein GH733_009609 [Mirounga leonina]
MRAHSCNVRRRWAPGRKVGEGQGDWSHTSQGRGPGGARSRVPAGFSPGACLPTVPPQTQHWAGCFLLPQKTRGVLETMRGPWPQGASGGLRGSALAGDFCQLWSAKWSGRVTSPEQWPGEHRAMGHRAAAQTTACPRGPQRQQEEQSSGKTGQGPTLVSTERALTVLHVSLHHPAQDPDTFANHDTSPLLVGRGPDAHLRLQLPRLSRRHLSLEPYREKGSALLTFCLKALSRKGCVWANGLTLRFLEQVPLSVVNRVAFSGIQMVVRVEGGTSLEAFVCCFHLSPSPLIHRPQAEETDEWESTSQEQLPPSSGHWAPGHLGLLHGRSLPSPGGGAETQL